MSDRRVAIVIGAGGGVGAEVSRGLARQGNDLVMVYHSSVAKTQALAEELEQETKVSCLTVRCDVTKQEERESLVAQTMARFGRVDILVSTQGHLHDLKFFHQDTPANIEETIDVELRSVIYLCHAVIPIMMQGQRGGRIITLGSDSGKVGSLAEAVSAACRGGVIAFSKGLARELARHSITVNCVCPGPIDTGLMARMVKEEGLSKKLMEGMVRSTPLRRAARPEEVAAPVVFLASPEASFITGQAISASGGLTMC